jgi:hypothetical protein
MANKRVTDIVLPANFADGQILYGADINKIITVLKDGVNANKADIDKIVSGNYNSYVRYSLGALNSILDTEILEDGTNGYVFNPEIIGDGLLYYKYNLAENSWVFQDNLNLTSLYESIKTLEETFEEVYEELEGLDEKITNKRGIYFPDDVPAEEDRYVNLVLFDD